MSTHSLFFYGTLVHPSILARVIGNDGAHLTTSDALLPVHTRHHVKGEDYPAVVDAGAGRSVMGRELDEIDGRVQGSLVEGLTDTDLAYLDKFEGDEYERRRVKVKLDSSEVDAEVYIWTAPLSRLEPSIWTFKEFLRDSAHRWVGAGADNQPDYVEVDRRRAMDGCITPRGVHELSEQVKQELNLDGKNGDAVAFGKLARERYWTFEDGWRNLNHGAYGVAPRPVVDAFQEVQRRSQAAPDRFMRYEYMHELNESRKCIAGLINCDKEDVVFVTNATSGVNAVLRSLTNLWQRGDKLLYFPTSIYDACSATLKYIVDTHPHLALTLVPVPLRYPLPHAAVIEKTKAAIAQADSAGVGKIRLALIDGISSNPGVIVPWPELVSLLREHDILSLVDAAHEIGQRPVNLKKCQPDFWVSNCHKWLLTPRSCAVLYSAKQHQHRLHAIPTGHYYRHRPDAAPQGTPDWANEFEWNGTIDFSAYLSVPAALDFRRRVLGGEDRIRQYCHNLAIEAGEHVAKVLGTETMRNKTVEEGELVANMINVRLPVTVPSSEDPEFASKCGKIRNFFQETQAKEFRTLVPLFFHDGKAWARISAQVYNDMEEYEWWAPVARKLCERINAGEYLHG